MNHYRNLSQELHRILGQYLIDFRIRLSVLEAIHNPQVLLEFAEHLISLQQRYGKFKK